MAYSTAVDSRLPPRHPPPPHQKMDSSILLLAAAFLVVQGTPQVQEAPSSATNVPTAMVAANGSTLEDIMQELHPKIRWVIRILGI